MLERAVLVGSLTLVAATTCGGCGCEDVGATGPCTSTAPSPVCGQGCTNHDDCPAGFHCGEQGCWAECDESRDCRRGETCDALGSCLPPDDGGAQLSDGGDCPHIEVTLTSLIPEVILLIDQSSSMEEDFGGADRWGAVRDALVDPQNGVVTQLQAEVSFGATLFTGFDGNCPALTSVPPSLNNFDPISQLLTDNLPANETPTGDAISAVVTTWPRDPDGDPVARVIVLATDGEPDTCAVPNPQTGQPESIAAVQAAYAQGIRTFALSVGNEVGAEHLQDVANAGAGLQVGGADNAPYYTANDPAELQAAFEEIVGRARSCVLTLQGTLDLADAPEGEVVLNHRELAYDDPNGWRVVDPQTIELLGDACTEYVESEQLSLTATFPCGSVLF